MFGFFKKKKVETPEPEVQGAPYCFSMVLAISEGGDDLNISIGLPENLSNTQIASIATVMHNLTNGQLNQHIIESFLLHRKENQEVVDKTISFWSQLITSKKKYKINPKYIFKMDADKYE